MRDCRLGQERLAIEGAERVEGLMHELGIEPSAIIIQAIGFLILFFILKRTVFGKIGTLLEDRRREIRQRMDKLEADQQELNRLQEEVRQRLVEIELEARARLQVAVEEANAERARILDQTSRDVERELDKARQEIQREKEQAIAELRAQVADLALMIAERVLSASLDGPRHRKIIEDFIEQLPAVHPG